MERVTYTITTILFVMVVVRSADCTIQVGINIDPKNTEYGYPSALDITESNSSWVRIEYKDQGKDPSHPSQLSFYLDAVKRYKMASVRVLMILDYSSMPGVPWGEPAGSQKWTQYSEGFVQRLAAVLRSPLGLLLDAVEIWNEEDLKQTWVPAETYGSMLGRAYAATKSTRPGLAVIFGGTASGDPGYVQKAVSNGAKFDYVGLHPYGQRPTPKWPSSTWGFGVLTQLVSRYHIVAGKPVFITEVGTNDASVQGEFPERAFAALQSVNGDSVCPVCLWFCWSDGMVSPFGLLTHAGDKKKSYYSFAAWPWNRSRNE